MDHVLFAAKQIVLLVFYWRSGANDRRADGIVRRQLAGSAARSDGNDAFEARRPPPADRPPPAAEPDQTYTRRRQILFQVACRVFTWALWVIWFIRSL